MEMKTEMKSADDEPSVEHISDVIGEWGGYQRHYVSFITFASMVASLHNLGYAFHSPKVEHWCADVPAEVRTEVNVSKCHSFLEPESDCLEWRYDHRHLELTIVEEFDLVCDRKWYGSMTQSLYQGGYVISGLLLTQLADKFGRRPVVLLAMTTWMTSAIVIILSQDIYQYALARFFLGIGTNGTTLIAGVILFEIVGTRNRATAGLMEGVGWSIGYVLLAIVAYWLRNFRYIQLAATAPLAPLLLWFLCFTESPRWFLASDKPKEAESVLARILARNGLSKSGLKGAVSQLHSRLQNRNRKQANLLDLFKDKSLRRSVLVVWACYAAVGLLYYGLSFNMADLGSDLFVSFGLGGLIEFPSILVTMATVRHVERKTLLTIYFSAASVSCFVIAGLNGPGNSGYQLVFGLVAKFFVNGAFFVCYVVGAEIFPTVLRSTGMGAASVVGLIGSVPAPFVVEYGQQHSMTAAFLCYGVCALTVSILTLMLPKTKGAQLPDTILESEVLCKKAEQGSH